MYTANIQLFTLKELNTEAQEKAITAHREFLDSRQEEYENEAGGMETEYVEHTRAETIDNIEINEYIFYTDGTLAHCTTYTGKHPKAGITEFHLHGQTITL